MAQPWWQALFSSPLWQEVQRQAWAGEISLEQAEQIETLLDLTPPAEILDVPCGVGRLTLPLAARGYRLTGVDVTEPFLADARRAAQEAGLDVQWVRQDMRQLEWSAQFDAALSAWGSFGYFDDSGNLAYLRGVARSLRPGGRFLIDSTIRLYSYREMRELLLEAGFRSCTGYNSLNGEPFGLNRSRLFMVAHK